MKNVLICGAGMSATDLISYMLNHADEYNWYVTVGDISVETAKRKIKSKGILFPWNKEVYEPVLNELAELGIAYTAYDNKIERSQFE